MYLQIGFLVFMLLATARVGLAVQTNEDFDAVLLRDSEIQALMSQIEEAKDSANQHLAVVRQWLNSEVSFMRSWGSERPTIELADSMRFLDSLANELDPEGKNEGAMKYLWIHAPSRGLLRNWRPGWNTLEEGLEDGTLQEEIRSVPLHPHSILTQVEPRVVGGTTNFNRPQERNSNPPFFPNRPRPVFRALVQTVLILEQMLEAMTGQQDDMEWNARPFGGLDSFSSERMAAAQNARNSVDEVWNQWSVASFTVRDMVNRVRAMEAFRH